MRKTVPTIAALVAFTGAGVGTVATMSTAQAADSSCTTTVPADRTAVTLANADGGSELGAGWAAKISVNLTGLDGCSAGAKAVIGLPKEIALGQVGKVVPIKDASGNLIANATISADSVAIELTDFASTHQNVNAHFEAWASASEALNTTEDVTLTWTVNGETHSTVVKGQPSVGVPKGQMPDEAGKGGAYNADTGLIRIGLRTPINHDGAPFTVTDKLTTGGQAIDCGALSISGEQFSAVDSDGDAADDEGMDVKVSDCNAGSVSFMVDPKKGYAGSIYFNVKVTEPTAGVWKDSADFLQNGQKVGSASARVIDYGASGGGSGEGIPLPPTDEPTTPPVTDTPSETPTTEPTTPTDTPTTDAPTEPSTPTETPTTDAPTAPATDEPTTSPSETPTEPTTPTAPATDTTTEPTKPSTDKPSEPSKPSEPTKEPTKPAQPTAPAKTPAKTMTPAPAKTDAPTTGPKIQTDHIDRKSPYGVVLILGALLAAAAALGTLVGIKLRKTGK